MATRIGVCEDDADLRSVLERALRAEGFEVRATMTGHEAVEAFSAAPPDLLVLDVGLPDADGRDVCQALRSHGVVAPVIFLTARDALTDRLAGFHAGGDDYLTKPFALEELMARLRALLRRTGADERELLRFGDLALDPVAHEVRRGEREIELTRTEFLLLELLMRHPRQVLPRSVIFEHVWGYDFGSTSNSLEVYVGYLRRKTEAGDEPRVIHTVRGVGYVLRER